MTLLSKDDMETFIVAHWQAIMIIALATVIVVASTVKITKYYMADYCKHGCDYRREHSYLVDRSHTLKKIEDEKWEREGREKRESKAQDDARWEEELKTLPRYTKSAPCPACGEKKNKVVASVVPKGGSRYVSVTCLNCKTRWSLRWQEDEKKT